MSEYFTPPDGFNYDFMSGVITIGLALIIIIGAVLITASVFFVVIRLLMLLFGKSLPNKKIATIFFVCLFVGILLLSGGWLSVIKMGQVGFIHDVQKILGR